MKRIAAVIGLSVAGILVSTWAGNSGSPVGTWETKKTGGFAYFTFQNDGTVTGYGGAPKSLGLFAATGTWENASGTITGQLFDLAANLPSPFKGKATTTKLNLHLKIGATTVALNGKPLGVLPDPSGHWVGTAKQMGETFDEVVDITATVQPGVFDVNGTRTGTVGDVPVIGRLLINSKSKSFVYVGEDTNGASASLAGKIDTIDGTAKLSGVDTNRHSIKINLTRQNTVQ